MEKAKHAGGGGNFESPPSGLSKTEALREAGLTKQTANRCEIIASVPEDEFEGFIAEKKAQGKPIHSTELINKIVRAAKENEREERREENREKVAAVESPTFAGVILTSRNVQWWRQNWRTLITVGTEPSRKFATWLVSQLPPAC